MDYLILAGQGEGFGYHVPKLLIYVLLFFGLAIQGIDIMRRRARGPIGFDPSMIKTELLAQLGVDELRAALEEKTGRPA